MPQEPRGAYEYNGLNWRTVVLRDAPPNFQGMETQKRTLCYDQRWRLLEERIDDDFDAYPGDGDDRLAQMVWGERYIDDAVLRRESNNLTNDGSGTTWEDEWNYVTDAMFSVVAVIDASTAALVERTRYTPYGVARHSWPSDMDGDGESGSADSGLILGANGKYIHESGYLAEADIDRSGRVTQADYALYAAQSALAEGQVGESGSGKSDSAVGFDGMQPRSECAAYSARTRLLLPELGRWQRTDPLDYVDGSNRLAFSTGRPTSLADPMGLASDDWGPPCGTWASANTVGSPSGVGSIRSSSGDCIWYGGLQERLNYAGWLLANTLEQVLSQACPQDCPDRQTTHDNTVQFSGGGIDVPVERGTHPLDPFPDCSYTVHFQSYSVTIRVRGGTCHRKKNCA